jgi:hypothetical protein
VESADDQRFPRGFEAQGQRRDLNGERREGQEVVAVQRGVGGVKEMRAEQ